MTPSSRRAVGPLLAVIAVGLLALNLRPGATSVGPLMSEIVADYGQGAVASGLLTALPCLTFGIVGTLAVPIARVLGLTGTVLASFVLVVLGLLLRPTVDGFGLFVLLSVVALLGPALGNVLLPAWIKQHGGTRVVGLMTLYSVVLASGATAAAMLAVPLAGGEADGWRHSLPLWGLIGVAPVLVWAVVLTRTGHDFPPPPPEGQVKGRILSSPRAIALTVMFGMQSLNAYCQFGLLPQVLTSEGTSPATAGVVVGVLSAFGIVGGLIVPTLVSRSRRLPWICAGYGVLTAAGYGGLMLFPQVSPFVWATVLGIAGLAFPTAIALIPARTRAVAVTARLSGIAQPLGYVLAAVGPLIAGGLLDATGSIPAVLTFLALTGVVLGVAGFVAARPGTVDDDLALRAAPADGA